MNLSSVFLEIETIPCTICQTPTQMLGTKLCNSCWEVTSNLRRFMSFQNGREYIIKVASEKRINLTKT